MAEAGSPCPCAPGYMSGAPDFAWLFILVYLAKIHKFTWNEEQQYMPATVHHGQTHVILHLLQFTFWEQVLYFYNVDDF